MTEKRNRRSRHRGHLDGIFLSLIVKAMSQGEM
jgi:hypothetical protein